MERPKYRYHLAFQCTKNGHFRTNMTYYVNAFSEAEAKRQVKEIFPDVKAFRIIGKWDNTAKKKIRQKKPKRAKALRRKRQNPMSQKENIPVRISTPMRSRSTPPGRSGRSSCAHGRRTGIAIFQKAFPNDLNP